MPTVAINNVNLYYEEAGKGFPVVLCHGYTGSHYDWALQVPMLSRRHHVVAMDHRGHGLSQAPRSGTDYSIPIFSEDVRALLEHLGIHKCCLVGHSMGGFIALQLTVDYPQLVDALILVDTAAVFGRMPEYAELMARLQSIARTDGMEAVFEYAALNSPMTLQYLEKYPDRREVAKQKMLNTSVDAYIYAWEAIAGWQGVMEKLSEIAVPTMIFVGEEDVFFREPSDMMAQVILGTQLRIIPSVGHSPHEEAPYTFNRELAGFLANIPQK